MSELQKKISDLEEDIKTKDANYQKEIADRDFNDSLKESIQAAHGINAKAITALLDVETLKASKNQKEDITAALKTLSEAEDSKMLFGGNAPNKVGAGNPIGNVGNGSAAFADDAQMYIALLDEIYKYESKTIVLDGENSLARQGANANELIIPMLDMDGLADYSRSSGYTDGCVDFNFETVKCNFDRGRMFVVDVMDDIETMGMVFGKLSSEFVRTKVIPELDAFRIAKYASLPDISVAKTADLTTGAQVVSALRAATTTMNNDEVAENSRILFIETGLKGLLDDMDTNKSKAVLNKFSSIVEMPQNRMYTSIKQLSGKDEEKAGGYAMAEGASKR